MTKPIVAKQSVIAKYSKALTLSLLKIVPRMLVQNGAVCKMTMWIISGIMRDPRVQRAKPISPVMHLPTIISFVFVGKVWNGD